MASPQDFAPFSLADVLTNVNRIKAMQASVQDEDEQRKERASLKQLFANGNMPTVQQASAISPEFGMKLAQNQQQIEDSSLQRENVKQQMAVRQASYMKEMATDIVSKADQIAQRGSPQWVDAVGKIAPAYYEEFSKITGRPMPQPGQAPDINSLLSIAGQTPAQQQHQELQQRESMALFQHQLGAPEREAARAERQQANEFRQGIQQQQLDLQKQNRQDKIDKITAEKQDAISNIDDTIADFTRLKNIQSRTATGPVVGSAPVAFVRKALPGGEDLQALEKGYNNLAIKAIGAFKAGGVTFGQLSNKEGEWIRSTQAAINSSEGVNKDLLDQGIKLLQERRQRILSQGGNVSPQEPANAQPMIPGGYTHPKLGKITQADLEKTAKETGMTVDQVKTQLGLQ